MKCNECYWCTSNNALSKEMVCCNKESENYNKPFPKEELENYGCEEGESEREVDYGNMTAWQFASKYYM